MSRKQVITIAGAGALLVCMGLTSSGCSKSGLAVGAMVPILDNAKTAAMASSDARTFKDASASNLFLMEGLIETSPDNKDLRLSAAMLYFSYAFMLEDEDDMAYPSTLYLRGLAHAEAVLLKNKKLAKTWEAPADEFEAGLVNMTEKDVPAAVWAVGNWAQFVALHLDSTAVMLDIPRVQALLQRTIELDGTFFEGLPYIIMGTLHAFRPPLMGGDPEASKTAFESAFEISDRKFLLAQYFYARYYCYRILDDEAFEAALNEVLQASDDILPAYRLLNTIAKQKSYVLLGEEDELF